MKLADSLKDLQELVDVVEQHTENGTEIPENLVPEIQVGVENFKASIDKRISTIENLTWYSGFIDDQVKALQKKQKALKKALEGIKKFTQWQVEQNPELEWRGTDKQLCLQKASQGKKDWRIKFEKHENVIPVELLQYVPKDCYREHVVYLLDKDKVNKELKDRAEDFYNLVRLGEQGNYLKIK